MANEQYVEQLKAIRTWFENTTSCFQDADGAFAPRDGMFTVSQHIAHSAQTVEWFLEGAFRPEGFNLDFEALEAEVRDIHELEDARAWWNSALDQALEAVEGSAPASWQEAIRGKLMGGMPRSSIFAGMADHTAHHRGALAVYARLCDRQPPMPYM